MDYRLVTYQCLHFSIIAQHDYNLNEPDDSSYEGLFTKPTSSHRASNSNCNLVECQSISRDEWLKRVNEAISSCKQYLASAVNQYYYTGFQYHGIPPKFRAATVKNSLCEAAHQQFGIKNCSWADDTFFEEWQSTLGTLRDLNHESFAELDDAGRAEVVAVLNATRATLSGVQGRIATLVQGVEIIKGHQQQMEGMGNGGASRGRKDTRATSRHTAPTHIFGRAVYKVWEKRAWGLWEAFTMA